jgi:hypothetical protein
MSGGRWEIGELWCWMPMNVREPGQISSNGLFGHGDSIDYCLILNVMGTGTEQMNFF